MPVHPDQQQNRPARRVSDKARSAAAPVRLAGWSLRYGVLLPGLLLLLSVVPLVAFQISHQVDKHSLVMSRARADQILVHLQTHMKNQQHTQEQMAVLLANDAAVVSAAAGADTARLQAVLAQRRSLLGVSDLMYFDAEGTLRLYLGPNETRDSTAREFDWSILHGATNYALLGSPFSDGRTTAYGLQIVAAAPVIQSGRNVGALLLTSYQGSNELTDFRQQEQWDDASMKGAMGKEYLELAVFRGDQLVATTLPTHPGRTVIGDLVSLFHAGDKADAMAGDGTHTAASGHRVMDRHSDAAPTAEVMGRTYALSSTMAPDGGRVVVLVSGADMGMRDGIIAQLTLSSGLALALLLILGLFVASIIVRPLHHILQVTRAITGGDFSQHAPQSHVRELNELGNAISFMAERIETRITTAEQAATTDFLTGLYNHRYFQEAMGDALQRATQNASTCALLMIDLDSFKLYNDSLGHQAGDVLLRMVAQTIRQSIRATDIPCRYGGDEFAVILPETDALAAAEIGHRMRQAVALHRFSALEALPGGGKVSVSIGIAVSPDHARTKEQMIKYADEAMYKQKNQSKLQALGPILDQILPSSLSRSELRAVIQSWMTTIRAKDRLTYGHSERLVSYADPFARAIGLSGAEAQELKLAAFLHDIGKIEIDAAILTKPAELSAAEWEIVRLHPVWGAELLRPYHELAGVTPAILYHHERWDGNGYPHRLHGENIPLGARVLAIIDAFDTMISDRPYKEMMTYDDAFAELQRCSGAQFDPHLTCLFVETCRPLAKQGLLGLPLQVATSVITGNNLGSH